MSRGATSLMMCLGAALIVMTLSAQTPSSPSSIQTPTKPPAEPPATGDPLPDGPGKRVLFKLCNDCHGPDQVVGLLKTRDEWSLTLDNMAKFGAEGTDQEYEQILEYLVRNFSPINVNKATAKELASALDISTTVAEAIVKYREDRGRFTSIDDLKGVPGLEAAKVDARKDRLTFGPR